jgi:hypothetical protein
MPIFSVGGAIIGSSLLGGYFGNKAAGQQADAANNAANLQNQATQQATAENARQFDIGQTNLAPWLSAGQRALASQQSLMGLGSEGTPTFDQAGYDAAMAKYNTPTTAQGNGLIRALNIIPGQPTSGTMPTRDQFTTQTWNPSASGDTLAELQKDPGYQFRLTEGQNALNNKLGAMGSRSGSRAMRSAIDYNQGFASQEYGNRLNQLAALSGTGQTTGTNMANQGMNFANNQGNMLTNNANAGGSALMAGANARASGLNGIGNAVNNGINQYMMYKYMQ